MTIKFIGKNIKVTDAIKDYTTTKLEKLDKFFEKNYTVKALYKVEKNNQTVEFTVYYDSLTLRAEVTTEDLYTSIDKATDILVSQIVKQKKRLKNINASIRFASEDTLTEDLEEEKKIVKRKEIELLPMYEEEAIMQMELLNHDMFVFLDADSDSVKVLYRRKDGQYGLLKTI